MSNVIQGSPEWFQERCGFATGSNFDAVLAKGKGGAEATTRLNYKIRVALEQLLGKPQEGGFKSAAMNKGTEREPFALMALEESTGSLVERVSFIPHSYLKAGVSPDGLIGDDEGVEAKCPEPAAHMRYLDLIDEPPSEYRAQVQGGMLVTGRKVWNFVSYNPDFPPELQLHIVRVKRDEEYISNLELELMKFLSEVKAIVSGFEGRIATRRAMLEMVETAGPVRA